MNKHLTDRIFQRCPFIYRSYADGSSTLVNSYGFECGDGWFEIILNFSIDAEAKVKEMKEEGTEKIRLPLVLQVKEKLGGLRIYMDKSCEMLNALIESAQKNAARTCELCGDSGIRRESRKGAWMTLCNECAIEHCE